MPSTKISLMATSSLESTLIVMPAFNEEASIVQVIREIRHSLPEAKVLVVDDGSSDDTASLARAEGVLVCSLPFNLGVGGAMRCGFKFALENDYQVAVQLDSDGQHDPLEVSKLLATLGINSTMPRSSHPDVAIGARFAGEGEYEVNPFRRLAMWFLSKALSRITGTNLTDTTSGFKAYGPLALEFYSKNFPAEYLGDTIEALVLGSRAGLKFKQVPVSMRERLHGQPSQTTWRSIVYLTRALIALMISLIEPTRADS